MRKLAIALFLASGSIALAGGYDEFVKAGAARRAGNYEMALSSYTAALAAGDLAPAYQPDAYTGRAWLYLRNGKCAPALDDLNAALKARPAMLEALQLRTSANQCLGHPDLAMADFDQMVTTAPSVDTYAARANFQWVHGAFAKAAEDYAAAVARHNKRSFDWQPGTYALVWYAVTAARAKRFDAADYAAKTETFDLDHWPGPLVKFFMGKASGDDVKRALSKADGDALKSQQCEADFMTGEWLVSNDKTAEGKALLNTALQSCPQKSALHHYAELDLKRLP
jgi:tetratricopeptide (TPR) repeat protein